MKLLLVKTSSMGDVIHAFPAVTDMLAAHPGLTVDWLVEESFADVARLHPGVAEVIPVATRRWRKAPFSAATRGEIAALSARLRAAGYDRVLDMQGLIKSMWLARRAGRPVDGYAWGSMREPIASLGYARRHRVPWAAHAIDRNRLLAAAALGHAVDLDRLDWGLARGRPAGRTVMLLHGTSWPSKRWSTEAWIETARLLAAHGFVPTVTWASAEEETVARAIAAAEPAVVLLPKGRLADAAAAIAASAGAIGTDTGLTHLAVAWDRPTIAAFLSTVPDLTGPKGRQVEIVTATTACAPCRQRLCPKVAPGETAPCTATVRPADVVARFLALAEERQP